MDVRISGGHPNSAWCYIFWCNIRATCHSAHKPSRQSCCFPVGTATIFHFIFAVYCPFSLPKFFQSFSINFSHGISRRIPFCLVSFNDVFPQFCWPLDSRWNWLRSLMQVSDCLSLVSFVILLILVIIEPIPQAFNLEGFPYLYKSSLALVLRSCCPLRSSLKQLVGFVVPAGCLFAE